MHPGEGNPIVEKLAATYAEFERSDEKKKGELRSELLVLVKQLHPGTIPAIFRHGQSVLATLRKNQDVLRQFAFLREGRENDAYYPQAFVDLQSGQRLTDFVYCEISEYNCNGLTRARRIFPASGTLPRAKGPSDIQIREYARDLFLEHYGYEYLDTQGKVVVPASYNSALPEFYDGGELILQTFKTDKGFFFFNSQGKKILTGYDYPFQSAADECQILGNLAKIDAVEGTKGRNISGRKLFLINSEGENVLSDRSVESIDSLVEEDIQAPDLGQAQGSNAPKFFRKVTKILIEANGKFGVFDAQTDQRWIVRPEYSRDKAIELGKQLE